MGRGAERTKLRIWPLVWVGKSICWVRWKQSRKSTPWFTNETRDLKQAWRKLEQAWCKSKLHVFYLDCRDSVLNYKRALNTVRTAYFSGLIKNNKHNPRSLFNTVAKLTQKPQSMSCAPFNANDFLASFCNTIYNIRITHHLWLQ